MENTNGLERVEKDYAALFSINLDAYQIKNFKMRFLFFFSLEFKDNFLYIKKPFRRLKVDISSVVCFSVTDRAGRKDIAYSHLEVVLLTKEYAIGFYSANKISCDYLILNLLKLCIPQMSYCSTIKYIKNEKLKKISLG